MNYLLGESFDTEPIHFDKCFKTKEIKSYKDEVKADFYDDPLPPEKTSCTIYIMALTELVFKSVKIIYPQAILEEYKYKKPEIVKRLIDEDLTNSDFNDESDSWFKLNFQSGIMEIYMIEIYLF